MQHSTEMNFMEWLHLNVTSRVSVGRLGPGNGSGATKVSSTTKLSMQATSLGLSETLCVKFNQPTQMPAS